jgi:hypothetical protein
VRELPCLRGGPEAGLGGEPVEVAANVADQHARQFARESIAHHHALHHQILLAGMLSGIFEARSCRQVCLRRNDVGVLYRVCMAGDFVVPISLSALVAAAECLGVPDFRVPPFQAVAHLFHGLAAAFAPQGRFEAGAIHILILFEIAAQRAIVLGLRIAQSQPPILARRVDALRACFCEQFLRALLLVRSLARTITTDFFCRKASS